MNKDYFTPKKVDYTRHYVYIFLFCLFYCTLFIVYDAVRTPPSQLKNQTQAENNAILH